MNGAGPMAHIDDGRLLAHLDSGLDHELDSEFDPGSDATVASHLAECERCRARAERLSRDLHVVRVSLAAADPAPPPATSYDRPWLDTDARSVAPRRVRPWLRAAAVVAALALAVGPARAWIVDLLGPDEPTIAPTSAVAPDPGPQPAAVATTSFRPTSPAVTLVLGPGARGVRVRVEAATDDRVGLWSPWDDVGITVLPDRMDVTGLEGRSGEIRLMVPVGIRSVTLGMADGTRRDIALETGVLPFVTGLAGGA